MQIERTTDLNIIRMRLGQGVDPLFTWGKLSRLHEIGDFAIGEFHPWKRKGTGWIEGEHDMSKVGFHGWLRGRDVAWWDSLDAALVGLLTHKHTEGHSGLDYYICRMLGMTQNQNDND